MIYYISQGIAVFSFAVLLFSFWQKNKNKILLFQMISSSLYAIQYALLMAPTGAVVNIIGVIRASIFRKNNINKKFLYLFLIIYCLIGLIFWDGYLSLLPITASIIYTIVIFRNDSDTSQRDENNIRKVSIIVSILWIYYNFLVNAHVAFITEIILLISNGLAIIKNKGKVI